MIDLERIHEDVNLFMVTEFNVVKRAAIEVYRNIRRFWPQCYQPRRRGSLDFRKRNDW